MEAKSVYSETVADTIPSEIMDDSAEVETESSTDSDISKEEEDANSIKSVETDIELIL